MDLDDQRRTAIFETTDVGALPERPIAVERFGGALCRQVEHRRERHRRLEFGEAHMVSNVDILGDLPVRRSDPHRRFHDALAQAWHEAG